MECSLAFNEKALDRRAKSLHISSLVEENLSHLDDRSHRKDAVQHKEEFPSRMNSDTIDREKIRNSLPNFLDPFSIG